jgi:hypothetical protein
VIFAPRRVPDYCGVVEAAAEPGMKIATLRCNPVWIKSVFLDSPPTTSVVPNRDIYVVARKRDDVGYENKNCYQVAQK